MTIQPDRIWAEIVYAPPGDQPVTFVARVPADFEESVLAAEESAFIRFEYVRWLDEEGRPYGKEEDDEVGTDHFFYLRKSTIYCLEPIRGEFVKKWDATLPDFAP